MRKLFGILTAAVLAVGVAGSASAATIQWGGALQLLVGTLPGLTLISGGVTNVTTSGANHLSGMTLPNAQFTVATSNAQFTINSGTVQGISFVGFSNKAGNWQTLSAGAGVKGTMGFNGTANICIGPFAFGPGCLGFKVPVALGGGLGVGGMQFVFGYPNITFTHNPWGLGPNSAGAIHGADSVVQTPTVPGFVHGPVSLTSSTAQNSGVVQLATVTRTITSLTAFPQLPVIAVLNVHFVPEPGTLLLLGAGAAGAAILGRRRMKS